MLVAGVGAVLGMASGCSFAPRSADVPEYIIGVRYGVEPLRVRAGRDFAAGLDADFARVAELDFNMVMAVHVADEDRAVVLQTAAKHGLRVILEDRAVLNFVRAGRGGKAPPDGPWALYREALGGDGSATLIGVHCGSVANAAMADRLERLAGRMSEERPPGTLLTHEADATGIRVDDLGDFALPLVRVTDAGRPTGRALRGPAIAVLPVSRRRGDAQTDERSWLAAYHGGLCAGATRGVILDAYSEVPGHWRGLVGEGDTLSPSRAAALKRLIERARRWGPRLAGATVEPVAGAEPRGARLELVRLRAGRRQYILVANCSITQFVRGTVAFRTGNGDEAMARLVEVPGAASTALGRVLRPLGGQFRLDVDLRPGEAELYEAFGPR